MEAARTHPPGLSYAATTTGLPRKKGFACCSIVAKQEFISTCMTVDGEVLNFMIYMTLSIDSIPMRVVGLSNATESVISRKILPNTPTQLIGNRPLNQSPRV